MSQCVPNWDLDETPTPARLCLRSNSSSTPPDVPILDYEVAELTWENGQLATHGLGPPRVQFKSQPATAAATTWDKPRANGTLESIVNQATVAFPGRKQLDDLVPWFDPGGASATATMTMDALVPCAANNAASRQQQQNQRTVTTRLIGCSTRVGSCSDAGGLPEEDALGERKRARVLAGDWSGRAHSVSGSATVGRDRDRDRDKDRDSQQITMDTCDRGEVGVGFTSTSMGSPENTSSGFPCTKATTGDDHDSVCHSRSLRETGDEEDKMKRSGKSSVSTKRSRAAAIHNQSERKRRDKINQRMKTLQKLVPNSSKTDKASVLDEVIDYLKQLQAQVQVMNRMNMQPAAMMLPMAMQQQLQMSMMAPMGLGMGMGMGMGMAGVMDMNTLARSNIPGMPTPSSVLHPATSAAQFMPLAASWDGSGGDRGLHTAASAAAMMGDPMAAFFSCQSQPMTLDAYSRMAAMYQQLAHQPPASSSKN